MLVEAFARPEHHAVLAECHGRGISITREMANGEDIHIGRREPLCGIAFDSPE